MELIRKTTHYVVCLKPRDVVSEDEPGGMPERISKVLSLPLSSIYPVHRLDRATSGVMVYALDAGTAAFLGRAVTEQKMHKLYYAITETAPQVPSGSWTDLLYWDRKQQKSYVVDRSRKGVKEARMDYEQLTVNADGHALLRVTLHTGRTHQIRVQCGSRGLPLLGDRRYGSHEHCALALFAYSLSFPDPDSGNEVTCLAPAPDEFPWSDPCFTPFLIS